MTTYRIIRVLCCENTSYFKHLVAKAVERSENTDFNHVCFLSEMNIVYEAIFPKTRMISFDEWKNHFKVIRTYELRLEPKVYNAFMKYITEEIGKPYSIWQIIMIYLAQNVHAIQKKIETTLWNGKKALICSEFVAAPLADVLNVKLPQGIDTIGMDEIEEMLKQIAYKVY